jgi:luciferase family oxidoreductase group 1
MASGITLSVLDLSPVPEGQDAGQALRNSLDLARHTEVLGYRRYWMAEHHNMPGIASAATAVVLAHIAAGTRSIRVGSGGIMLPNHAPLLIAEQFGTLAALHPVRIDLGLGRAPGSDQITARAIRRTLSSDIDDFAQDVIELIGYFEPAKPGQPVQAVPGGGLDVPVWILGSSAFGAQLAATLGLPFAFASHFAPAMMEYAVALYRERFRPSVRLREPYVMLGVNVFAADTDAEARRCFRRCSRPSSTCAMATLASYHRPWTIWMRTFRLGPARCCVMLLPAPLSAQPRRSGAAYRNSLRVPAPTN